MSIPLDSSQPKRGCKGLSLHTPTRLMGTYYERLIATLFTLLYLRDHMRPLDTSPVFQW